MPDKQFDNIINQKIRDAKIDVPKSDWNVFSQKLKVAMESTGPEDQLFDEAIKAKIAAASLAIPKTDWAAFAPKMQNKLSPDISDADFDKIINDKVTQGNITTPTPDWNVFSEKLADAQFDASIKQKVENPEIEIPKPDWPIFAGLLASSMAPGHDISDSQFDSAIQDKLVESNLDIPQADWNALSQKMQKAGLNNDKQLDAEVKSKLEDYSTRYEESHWAILREKMIQIRDLRRNLFGLKGFEAALTVLLFITFANFFADGLVNKNTVIAETAITAASNENTDSVQSSSLTTENQENSTITNTVDNQVSNAINTVVNNESPVEIPTRINNNAIVANNSARTSATATNIASNRNQNVSNSPTTISPVKEVVATAEVSKATAIASSNNPVTNNNNDPSVLGLKEIDKLGLNSFNTDRSIIDPAFVFSPSIKVEDKNENNNGWNLYIAAGRNTHQIFTPRDTLISNPAYSRKANNMQFEVRVGREFDDIELMTGLAYQRMEYSSNLEERIPIAQDVDKVYSIDNIRYDFIKVPLSARWNYRITNKFGFFADLGVSANILMKSDYYINEWEELENPGPETLPQPMSQEVEQFDPSSDFYGTAHGAKTYQDGFSEGGSLKQNLFGNLDSGIGFSFSPNQRIESYARANMSQQLGELSIGPNSDSFSTWGLQLGLKYRLK